MAQKMHNALGYSRVLKVCIWYKYSVITPAPQSIRT